MRYPGSKAGQISFPLGGIGSGCIGLGGDGRLSEWEIFNRPNKGVHNGLSHIAVKAVSRGELIDARALCGELKPPYLAGEARHLCAYGYVPGNDSIAGFPNFRESEFTGEYPFATIRFRDRHFPGAVVLTAFNPLIPLNEKDSSIPGAFFEITFENPTSHPVDYTAAFAVGNPSKQSVNTSLRRDGLNLLRLAQREKPATDPGFGELAIATDAARVTAQDYWFRGFHFDNHRVFWKDFASVADLAPRTYAEPGNLDHAVLAATVTVAPRSKESVRFVLTWHYPNCINYWKKPAPEPPLKGWKNYYATIFEDAADSAAYALTHWPRLEADTRLFKEALFSSTVPASVLDAVSANISILKSPTVLRLEDGSFWGWEGSNGNAGSCEGSCTHVWNYAYALPFLFPRLERSMRDLNYRYNQREDGGLCFRLALPLGSPIDSHRPCADGQFGDVMKVYRDWKICGDTEWLRRLWPSVRKSIEFAWNPANEDLWDVDKDGVLEGRQHHTLDREFFGPNSWLTGFYLGALKAASEMARAVGDVETEQDYRALFARGKRWVDENLFNGRFYFQKINLADPSPVKRFAAPDYWSEEHRQIKHQIGEGCGIDQVVAQWHANLSGLGEIFDRRQRREALRTIYRNNFKRPIRGVANPCRPYSLYDESGVLICEWPDAAKKPAVPVPYSEETMYGFEYAAAALMIQEGLVREGLEIVRKGRQRFDGQRRNPWNEYECGSNYARSMASFSLLPALSGLEFDLSRGMIGFSPVVKKSAFTCFWSLDPAWGIVRITPTEIELQVLQGELPLREFRSANLSHRTITEVRLGGETLPFHHEESSLLIDGILVSPRKNLQIVIGPKARGRSKLASLFP
jgi:uncharacterized protein (DUF608 family)